MPGPLPDVPNAVKIVLKGVMGGLKPFVNSFHYGWSVGGGLSLSEVTGLAGNIATRWNSNIGHNAISDTVILTDVIAQALDSSTAPMYDAAVSYAGGVAEDALPYEDAFVVQRKIGRRYRGGHSRIYLAGLTISELDHVNPAEWDAGAVASILANWVDLEDLGKATLVGQGRTDAMPVNISYYSGFTNVLYPSGRYHAVPTRRAVPVVDDVSSYGANPQVCSQRRRDQS